MLIVWASGLLKHVTEGFVQRIPKSTGPRSLEGKERVSRNAWKGGHRAELRELSKMVNEHVRLSRELAERCSYRRPLNIAL